jgi:hypothetical protein
MTAPRSAWLAALVLALLMGCGSGTGAAGHDAAGADVAGDTGGSEAGHPGPDGPAPDGALDGAEAADGGAGDAGGADGAAPPGQPVWFLLVTDTHFGGSGSAAVQTMSELLDHVVSVVQPAATIHGGDLVDDGSDGAAWSAYRAAVDGKAPAYPAYVEILGNHDVKNDGTPNWSASSVTGRAGAGTTGHTFVDTGIGKVRLLRTNTSDSDVNVTNIAGIFTSTQMNALLNAPEAATPAALTLVLGHHPMTGPARLQLSGSDTRMQTVISTFAAPLYLCGHVHASALSWLGGTLVVQGDGFGEGGPATSFMVAAVDDAGPVALEVPLDPTATPAVPWPVVMITTPADASLAGANPHAGPLAPGATPLRALAFAPGGITVVEGRVDGGGWQALQAAGGPVWAGSFVVPTGGGQHGLEVRATGPDGARSHALTFAAQ